MKQKEKDLYLSKIRISSCGCVRTAVWMHHMDTNEIKREKAK